MYDAENVELKIFSTEKTHENFDRHSGRMAWCMIKIFRGGGGGAVDGGGVAVKDA